VQIADINIGTFIHILSVRNVSSSNGFHLLEGRDCELVVTELAAVDFHSNRVSSYVFKRPYIWEELPLFNARMNQAIDHGCNWNDGDVLYSELETCCIVRHHLLWQSIASDLRKHNLSAVLSTVQLLI
jgi:hypothetical protein